VNKPVQSSPELIEKLAAEVWIYQAQQPDLERSCWLAVHREQHGMLPSEYDIREIDEQLYLDLLAYCRQG
jgi:hypothetical protein